MPYKVLVAELGLLEQIGEIKDNFGNHVAFEHQTVTYYQDDLVPDDKVSPVVKELYENGDEHTIGILEYVSDETEKEAPKARGGRPKKVVEENSEEE